MTHQVYISYSSKDILVANGLCAELEAAGIACWIAPRDVHPGQSWPAAIVDAISNTKVFILILSDGSNQSKQVLKEVEEAIENGIVIIPFRIEDVEPSPEMGHYIKSFFWFDAIDTPLQDAACKLSKTIAQILRDSQVTDFTKSRPQYPMAPGSQIEPSISNGGPSRTQPFEAFISYRRATDAQTARLIRSELQSRGFRVFLDVENLRPGHFDEALLERIEEARSFILILSEGSLDNCANSDDWLRREIACALTKEKNIIPIMMPGFDFPATKELPQELLPLPVHHGINYSHEFFDAMMEKIVDYLGTPENG